MYTISDSMGEATLRMGGARPAEIRYYSSMFVMMTTVSSLSRAIPSHSQLAFVVLGGVDVPKICLEEHSSLTEERPFARALAIVPPPRTALEDILPLNTSLIT